VVVVDDSALVRGLLAEIINRQPDMAASARPPTRWWRAR
jgi:chemotaxis response regulator CheB